MRHVPIALFRTVARRDPNPFRHYLGIGLLGLAVMILAPAAGHADAVVAPTAIDFGDVPVNRCAHRTFTVSTDNADNPSVTAVQVVGSGEFEVTFGFGLPQVIPDAGGLTFTVTYMPGALGADAATVMITTSDGRNPTVALSGSSSQTWGPLFFIQEPPEGNFGNVPVGKKVEGRLLVRNDSTDLPVTLRFVLSEFNPPDFDFNGIKKNRVTEITVGPGETVEITKVKCRPSGLGERVGVVTWLFESCFGGILPINLGFRCTGVP